MKKILYLFIVCLSFIAFPSCDDRDEIRNDINDLNSRLDALDAQIDTYNTQISAYQDMVLGQTYIKDYAYDKATGNYVLTLSDGTAMSIYSGKPDNEIPQMYIAEDGTWHYTQDGTDYVLTGSDGNAISALPVDGKNGVTPQISIDEEGYWLVSMDGGATWERIGGSAPIASPDMMLPSIFQSVTVSEDGKSMTLVVAATGESVTIPVGAESSFNLALSSESPISVAVGQSVTVAIQQTNVKEIAIESTPLQVEITDTKLKVTAPATLAAADYTLILKVFSEEGYCKLVSITVKVTSGN